jgi:single-strand DNA-binding protein
MSSFNQVTILGNLTRDPQLKHLPSGTSVVDFGLAVNEKVKRNDQWVDEPMFIDVTFFGKIADTISTYLTKGSKIMVSGRLKLEQWEKDGAKFSKHKVIGDRMVMCGSKGDGAVRSQEPEDQSQDVPSGHDDDIPF